MICFNQVTANPPGVVAVSPTLFNFDQGSVGKFANLTLIWASPGLATLSISAMGGIYQNLSYASLVTVVSLPELPTAPSTLLITAVFPLALQIQWSNVPSSNSAVGYSVQVSFTANFTSTVFSADIPSDANLTSGRIRTPSLKALGCAFVRVFAYNSAGRSAPKGAECVPLVDEPPAVGFVSLTALGEEWIDVEWAEPTDLSSTAFDYLVEISAANTSLVASRAVPASRTRALLPLPQGAPMQVAVRISDPVRGQGAAAGVCLQLSNSKPVYLVPLQFTVYPLSVQAPAGSSSLVVLTPTSPPAVDAWVRVRVLDDFVASVTDHVLFPAGSMVRQNVIVSHLRKGTTNVTFVAVGGLYSGLEITVVIDTLPSAS